MDQRPITKVAYQRPRIKTKGSFIAADPLEARLIDVLGSIALIIFFAPLMVLIVIAVFVADPGPVLFRQDRIGRDGRVFKCLKFRTMVVDAEARLERLLQTSPGARAEWERDHKLRRDPRVAGIGRFLRKSSLDELPQLFNVLFGDMSLVGPRPIVEAETFRYGRYFAHYCAVRPGITGLWQISGRNDVNYRRRIAFDVLYVRSGRVEDNLRILFMTLPTVLGARGSY